MKLYIISGLGADRSVFEHINFPSEMELHFIDWLVPEQNEEFDHYVNRMAESINPDEDFCLLGYSFGGIIVQEIPHCPCSIFLKTEISRNAAKISAFLLRKIWKKLQLNPLKKEIVI